MTTISKTLKLDAPTVQRLSQLAERRDRSVHYLLCEAVHQFLTHEEESDQRLQEALTDWQKTEPAASCNTDHKPTTPRTYTIIAVQQDA